MYLSLNVRSDPVRIQKLQALNQLYKDLNRENTRVNRMIEEPNKVNDLRISIIESRRRIDNALDCFTKQKAVLHAPALYKQFFNTLISISGVCKTQRMHRLKSIQYRKQGCRIYSLSTVSI